VRIIVKKKSFLLDLFLSIISTRFRRSLAKTNPLLVSRKAKAMKACRSLKFSILMTSKFQEQGGEQNVITVFLNTFIMNTNVIDKENACARLRINNFDSGRVL
jgi:hypothetical protein